MSSHSRTQLIDTFQFGMPGVGAAYLLHGRRCVLIDTGTRATVRRWMDRLHSVDLCAILLTHVHSDHAGGLHAILTAHPEAVVYVASEGVEHLVDPSRLNDSVRKTAGRLGLWYGELLPVQERRVCAIEDDAELTLADDISVRAIRTPGHAPHHICYLGSRSNELFCGDAVGVRRFRSALPATSPPSFDLKSSLESLQKLVSCAPDRLCLTHFGEAPAAISVMEDYACQLSRWIARIGEHTRALISDDRVIATVLEEEAAHDWPEPLKEELAMFVRGAMRYIRKVI